MDTQEILDNADSISLEAEAIEKNQSKLCEIWPIAKQALEILKGLVKDPLSKIIIDGIIKVGDVVIGKICS